MCLRVAPANILQAEDGHQPFLICRVDPLALRVTGCNRNGSQ